MKSWKWIKLGIISLLSVAVITTTFVVLLWNVDAPTPINTYCLKFNKLKASNLSPEQEEQNKVINNKNKFIEYINKSTNKIINDYQKQTNNYEGLNFNFANLTNNQTQGEINYFTSLDRTLKEISPDLGIINQQRTPKLINEAFYNKNTEMMSFYWSPDYNSVGTWLKYMFTDTYTMPNMWPPTYAILKSYINILENSINGPYVNIAQIQDAYNKEKNETRKLYLQESINSLQTILNEYNWVDSLQEFILKFKIPGTNEKLFKSPIEILNYIPSHSNTTKIQIDDYYVNIANVIGTWVNNNSFLDIKQDIVNNNITGQSDIYTYQNNLPVGISYVNWIASQNPNIPYQEVGNGSKTPFLCSIGLYMPTNPNTDTSFRDWYCYNSEFNNVIVKDWWAQNPFQSNETAWNGPFSKAPNSLYAQSTWTGLTSWTTIGDENDANFPEENVSLVSNGIMQDITNPLIYSELEKEFNGIEKDINGDGIPDTIEKTLTFDIRPIPWVNAKGQKTGSYLSPADFYAGFKAFKRSIDNGINANNAYFIGLAAVDFDRTLNDNNNQAKNTSSVQHKPFKIYFKDPILNLRDTLDILQKQYFAALPFDHPEVQNIIDDKKYNAIAINYPNTQNLDIASTNMNKFYGVGVGYDKDVWGDLWSSAPYYISDINQQSITYKINREYFNSFNDINTKPKYKSFLLSNTINNKTINKLNEINIKYAGSYNLDILYEQFKAKELNKALLQSVNLMDALNNQKKYLRYQEVKKINKSNVIGFNLQIYEKWNEPLDVVPKGCNPAQNVIIDQDGNPMWDSKNRIVTYSIDEYGNYIWPKGKKPKRKSNVSQSYQDLIVSDFYTPLNKKSKSKTIRFTIMNSINWVSLKSLVTPGVSASIQYSFMPFGVYELYNQNMSIKSTYWDLSANKRYLTQKELMDFNELLIKKRMSGNMIWTYDELLNAMVKVN